MNPVDLPPLVVVVSFLAFAVIGATAVLERLGGPSRPEWNPGDPPNYRAYPCGDRRCRIDHDAVRPWVADRNR